MNSLLLAGAFTAIAGATFAEPFLCGGAATPAASRPARGRSRHLRGYFQSPRTARLPAQNFRTGGPAALLRMVRNRQGLESLSAKETRILVKPRFFFTKLQYYSIFLWLRAEEFWEG